MGIGIPTRGCAGLRPNMEMELPSRGAQVSRFTPRLAARRGSQLISGPLCRHGPLVVNEAGDTAQECEDSYAPRHQEIQRGLGA